MSLETIEQAKANAVETEEYKRFVDKFKPKKTTDDCYTPPYIYDAVLDWAVNEYGLQGRDVVRPFYPGGDYENYLYPENGVVIDNPPFSILSKIITFYVERNIDFFLFAPSLTLFSTTKNTPGVNAIITNSIPKYENGANIRTAFVTNMGEYKIHVCPQLNEAIEKAQKKNLNKNKVILPKYIYPENLITAATIQKVAAKGQELKIKADECYFIRSLDSQRTIKKGIFGGGYLLSERAAAAKAAAEKAAAEKAAAAKAAAAKAAAEKAAAEKAAAAKAAAEKAAAEKAATAKAAAEKAAAEAAIRFRLSERELDIVSHLGSVNNQ